MLLGRTFGIRTTTRARRNSLARFPRTTNGRSTSLCVLVTPPSSLPPRQMALSASSHFWELVSRPPMATRLGCGFKILGFLTESQTQKHRIQSSNSVCQNYGNVQYTYMSVIDVFFFQIFPAKMVCLLLYRMNIQLILEIMSFSHGGLGCVKFIVPNSLKINGHDCINNNT